MMQEQFSSPIQPRDSFTPEQLEEFRQEIRELFEAEKNGEVSTGHFSGHDGEFDPMELGHEELGLWEDFKDCREGEAPIRNCVESFGKYRDRIEGRQGKTGRAIRGFVSYLANKLAVLYWQEQIREEENKKKMGGG